MRNRPRVQPWYRAAIIVLWGLPVCILHAQQPDAAKAAQPPLECSVAADEPISQLRWLAGCWQRRSVLATNLGRIAATSSQGRC